MTPIEKRARAKELRAEARRITAEAKRLEQEADGDDFIAAQETRRLASREHAEEVAASGCRPVWDRAPPGGPWVVRGIVEGKYLIGHPLHARDDMRCHVSTGWQADTAWGRMPDYRVDPDATLKAWREWCAARKVAS